MDQEIEVKFYLADPAGFRQRVIEAGARLVQPRVLEQNLRFDTPEMRLRAKAQVLRLRQDQAAHLTFKAPGGVRGGVLERQEIEFTVGDFAAARRFLEALGFSVYTSYEKYRETFLLGSVLLTLDEMPFGYLTELEGPSAPEIRAAARQLGLNWERRILISYLELFAALKNRQGWDEPELSFEAFRGRQVSPADLGVEPADAAD